MARPRARPTRPTRLLCALAIVLPLAAAVSIIHGETAWTKRAWAAYRVEPGLWAAINPSDETIAQLDVLADVRRTLYNSLDGPTPRRSPPSAATL